MLHFPDENLDDLVPVAINFKVQIRKSTSFSDLKTLGSVWWRAHARTTLASHRFLGFDEKNRACMNNRLSQMLSHSTPVKLKILGGPLPISTLRSEALDSIRKS